MSNARQLERYASLDAALERFSIPIANRDFVRMFVEKIEITDFYRTTGYIKAVRKDGGPDMHIAPGWSNGFVSEAEVLQVLGAVPRWRDDERASVWGVSHPVHWAHDPHDPLHRGRDYGTCPECFTKFSANGKCDCS